MRGGWSPLWCCFSRLSHRRVNPSLSDSLPVVARHTPHRAVYQLKNSQSFAGLSLVSTISKMKMLPLSPRDSRSRSSKYVTSNLPRAVGGASTGMRPKMKKRLNWTATRDAVSGSKAATTRLKKGKVSRFSALNDGPSRT